MLKRIEFIRNMDAGDLLETVLVSAISSIFLIRFYLHVTGYPQLGNQHFHFAHMLWGGFFMLIALVLLLSFMGTKNRFIAAIIGGIGFGFFVDELGKFITRDNNYFFQPTIALLYLIFLLLFFLFRLIERARIPTQKEYLMNALELLKEAVLNDMDTEEKKVLDSYLKHAKTYHYLTDDLQEISRKIVTVNPPKTSPFIRWYHSTKRAVNQCIHSSIFREITILFFIGNSLIAMTKGVFILWTVKHVGQTFFQNLPSLYTFTALGQFLSISISTVLAILGIFSLQFSRLRAFIFFRYSILVTIFVTQFFSFYQNQFQAVMTLLLNVLLLIGINYVIVEERTERNAD